MNLWAVVEYITTYATKAPKGSRRLGQVLRNAVDEVCKYTAEGEGVDLLKKALQKFYSKTLGERDYGIFEAVHLLGTAGAGKTRAVQTLLHILHDTLQQANLPT